MSDPVELLENICTDNSCIRIEDVSNRIAIHLGHSGDNLRCSICFMNDELEDGELHLITNDDPSDLYDEIVAYIAEETDHDEEWVDDWLENELEHGQRVSC